MNNMKSGGSKGGDRTCTGGSKSSDRTGTGTSNAQINGSASDHNIGRAITDDEATHKWDVTGNNYNANRTKGNHVKQDANSVGSNDSRQMIIKKDVTWTIEHNMDYRME